MLVKCDIPESLGAVVSSMGPVDFAPAGLRRASGGWRYSLGGVIVLAIALFLLVLLADEAMEGGVLAAVLSSLGHA